MEPIGFRKGLGLRGNGRENPRSLELRASESGRGLGAAIHSFILYNYSDRFASPASPRPPFKNPGTLPGPQRTYLFMALCIMISVYKSLKGRFFGVNS